MNNKALFLDRDGIINVDHGYVYQKENFEFTDGIFDLVKLFTNADYLIFVVTNQSGIGRGYYSEEDFTTLTKWMREEFEKKDIKIEHVYHCPHSPEEKCHCRKPEIGMIEQALTVYSIDLLKSWMIGDKQSDIDLALNAGLGKSIYIGNETVKNCTYRFKTIEACRVNLPTI